MNNMAKLLLQLNVCLMLGATLTASGCRTWPDSDSRAQSIELGAVADRRFCEADRSAFPGQIGPRKNYSLSDEWAAYTGCAECTITANINDARKLMTATSSIDIFYWVMRPDGRLVVGKGPDAKMSHGVLASIDPADPTRIASSMGNVLAAGEGFFDSATGIMTVNNKSGHYRPSYQRILVPALAAAFACIVPEITTVKTVDTTKPGETPVGDDHGSDHADTEQGPNGQDPKNNEQSSSVSQDRGRPTLHGR